MDTTSFPFTWLDILILLPLLYGFIRGAVRGCISELIAILAVILGVIVVRMFGSDMSSWLFAQFAWPETVCRIVSAVSIFLLTALALTLLGSLLTKLFKAIHLGWINRLFGALIGALKWALLVAVIVFVINFLDGQFSLLSPELKNSSSIYTTFLDWATVAWNHIYPNINSL